MYINNDDYDKLCLALSSVNSTIKSLTKLVDSLNTLVESITENGKEEVDDVSKELKMLELELPSDEYVYDKLQNLYGSIPIGKLTVQLYELEPTIPMYLLNRFEPNHKLKEVVEACSFMGSVDNGLSSLGYVKGDDNFVIRKSYLNRLTRELIQKLAFKEKWMPCSSDLKVEL